MEPTYFWQNRGDSSPFLAVESQSLDYVSYKDAIYALINSLENFGLSSV